MTPRKWRKWPYRLILSGGGSPAMRHQCIDNRVKTCGGRHRECIAKRTFAHKPLPPRASPAAPASGSTTRYIHHTPKSMGRKFCASTHGEAHFTPLEPSAAKHTHRRNACALFHAHRQQRQANAADCAQNARQQKEALPPPHRHPQD